MKHTYVKAVLQLEIYDLFSNELFSNTFLGCLVTFFIGAKALFF